MHHLSAHPAVISRSRTALVRASMGSRFAFPRRRSRKASGIQEIRSARTPAAATASAVHARRCLGTAIAKSWVVLCFPVGRTRWGRYL